MAEGAPLEAIPSPCPTRSLLRPCSTSSTSACAGWPVRICGTTSRSRCSNATGLVHESYLRLAQSMPGQFVDREHFLRSASGVMHFVVVDFIRRRHAQSRGGDLMKITLVGAD